MDEVWEKKIQHYLTNLSFCFTLWKPYPSLLLNLTEPKLLNSSACCSAHTLVYSEIQNSLNISENTCGTKMLILLRVSGLQTEQLYYEWWILIHYSKMFKLNKLIHYNIQYFLQFNRQDSVLCMSCKRKALSILSGSGMLNKRVWSRSSRYEIPFELLCRGRV